MAFKSSEYSSLDLLVEAYRFLVEISQDVVKIITGSNEDAWKSKELRSLVDLYLKSTTETLDLFNTVENCAKGAETRERIIREAVKEFETETADTDVGGSKKKKYAKTLEELSKFKAMGDPFGEDFVTQYDSICKKLIYLREELCKLKEKLGKKQKKLKKLKILSTLAFATALAPVLAFSILLHGSPLIMVALGVSTTVRVNNMLEMEYGHPVKTQKDLVSETVKSVTIYHNATETINSLAKQLRTSISLILNPAGNALDRDDNELATRIVMREILKKVEGFTEKIEMVSKTVAEHSKLINVGRAEVVHYVAKAQGKLL